MLKKLILFSLLMALFVSCGTSLRGYYYFYNESFAPQYYIDSLSNHYGLNLPNLDEWNKIDYYANTKEIIPMYNLSGKKNDTLYIFSVIKDDDIYSLKMRLEYKLRKK